MTSTMSGMPFQIIYEPGGKIRISGELTSLEQADEFIAAVQALKHLMTPSPAASHGPEENAKDDFDRDSPADDQRSSSLASVSLMNTQMQKAALRDLGFT
jgi:hypothetical protein